MKPFASALVLGCAVGPIGCAYEHQHGGWQDTKMSNEDKGPMGIYGSMDNAHMLEKFKKESDTLSMFKKGNKMRSGYKKKIYTYADRGDDADEMEAQMIGQQMMHTRGDPHSADHGPRRLGGYPGRIQSAGSVPMGNLKGQGMVDTMQAMGGDELTKIVQFSRVLGEVSGVDNATSGYLESLVNKMVGEDQMFVPKMSTFIDAFGIPMLNKMSDTAVGSDQIGIVQSYMTDIMRPGIRPYMEKIFMTRGIQSPYEMLNPDGMGTLFRYFETILGGGGITGGSPMGAFYGASMAQSLLDPLGMKEKFGQYIPMMAEGLSAFDMREAAVKGTSALSAIGTDPMKMASDFQGAMSGAMSGAMNVGMGSALGQAVGGAMGKMAGVGDSGRQDGVFRPLYQLDSLAGNFGLGGGEPGMTGAGFVDMLNKFQSVSGTHGLQPQVAEQPSRLIQSDIGSTSSPYEAQLGYQPTKAGSGPMESSNPYSTPSSRAYGGTKSPEASVNSLGVSRLGLIAMLHEAETQRSMQQLPSTPEIASKFKDSIVNNAQQIGSYYGNSAVNKQMAQQLYDQYIHPMKWDKPFAEYMTKITHNMKVNEHAQQARALAEARNPQAPSQKNGQQPEARGLPFFDPFQQLFSFFINNFGSAGIAPNMQQTFPLMPSLPF